MEFSEATTAVVTVDFVDILLFLLLWLNSAPVSGALL